MTAYIFPASRNIRSGKQAMTMSIEQAFNFSRKIERKARLGVAFGVVRNNSHKSSQ